jgi:hypothetical protein
MPPAVRKAMPLLTWGALVTAFSIGGAWRLQAREVERLERDKLNVSTYRVDSLERAHRDSTILAELRAIRADGTATRRRVSAIYCARLGNPAGCE